MLWQVPATALVVAEASGYPHFLQQFGQETWKEARGPIITLQDARFGVIRGEAALDTGFFRARWDRAIRTEQQYRRAMASDTQDTTSSRDVASRLGREANSLGPARSSLIAKGLVCAPDHGVVALTVPGMADFIQRQASP